MKNKNSAILLMHPGNLIGKTVRVVLFDTPPVDTRDNSYDV